MDLTHPLAWPLAYSGSRLCPSPWPVPIWEYLAQIILIPWDLHWVHDWCTNQYPLHVLQRLGGVSVTSTSPLGHRREGQLLAPVHLLQPRELEGSKGAFGNSSSPGSQSDTETGPCSFSRRDQLGSRLQIPIQAEPNYWDVSPVQEYKLLQRRNPPMWGGALGVQSGYIKLLKNTHSSASAVCWLSRLLGGSMGCRDSILSSYLWCCTGSPAPSEHQHGHPWGGRGRK